jgi:membrane dipeptidase
MTDPRFLIDAHNDLLLEVEARSDEDNPFAATWLHNLEQGGVRLQVCPTTADLYVLPEGALRHVLQQVVACHQAIRDNPRRLLLVRTREDLDTLEQSDLIGLMLSMEGVEALGYSPQLADAFWELGVRMVSLTWNRRNAFADGLGEPGKGGLSGLGRELVPRLVNLGMILDLVHASEKTYDEMLELSGTTPIVVSHACCRAVHDTPRNLSDDQLRALAARGGVLGIMALPLVVDPSDWSIDRLIDHIDHAVGVMGIEHVGLGGDFIRQVARSGCIRMPTSAQALLPPGMTAESAIEGLAGPEGYPNLVDGLERRGYDGNNLTAILGGNFLRLFREALPAGAGQGARDQMRQA